jgi:hypothetical protein
MWDDTPFFHGAHSKQITDVDRMFGSKKFNVVSDVSFLEESAKLILTHPIKLDTFVFAEFVKGKEGYDVIAIKSNVATQLKQYFHV